MRAVTSLLLAALAAPPQANEIDLEELESPAGEGSALPSLVAEPGGSVLLSWVAREAPTGGRLLMARLGASGWSEPAEIARGDDWFLNWADFPSLGALEDGTLVAHWLRRLGPGTYDYGVEFVLSGSAGRHWSDPRWLHDDRAAGEHGFVSFAALDSRRFAAVWLDGRRVAETRRAPEGEGEMALYYRTISRYGELGPELLLDPRVCSCCQTALVAGGGEAWIAYRDRSDDEVRDVSFVHVREGVAGAPAVVRPDGWEIFGCPVNGPRLARAGDRVAAAWYTGAGGVFAAWLDPEGGGFGPAHSVDDGAPGGRVDVVGLPDGSILVSWLEHEAGAAEWRLRHVGLDGRRGASRTVTPISSARESGFLRMAPAPGGAVLAWTESGPSPRVRIARASVSAPR